MDHRISKDMISSGMIPSGEKNQEDLGKTQYGTVPSPNALADVYKKMYETKEEVINEHHKKDADGNTIPHEGEEINEILGMGTIATAGKALLTRIGKTAIGSQVKNIGKKVVKDFKKNPLDTAVKASVVANSIPKPGMPNVPAVEKPKSQGGMRSTQYASADLFDIVKGQLLDEGLSEEEIRDIMLTLTPDEILKEIEESSMSAGSSGGNYHDGGDGVFRSKEQIGNMFNKNIPTKKQTGGKVDKITRKSINTSAKELGIQGPTTLKQSVEPEGETI